MSPMSQASVRSWRDSDAWQKPLGVQRERGIHFPSVIVMSATLYALTWLAAFWALVFRARLLLGVWPQRHDASPLDDSFDPSALDPNTLDGHYGLVSVLSVGLPVIVLLALGSFAATVPFPRARIRLSLALIWVGMTGLLAVTLFCDPFGFVDWFLD